MKAIKTVMAATVLTTAVFAGGTGAKAQSSTYQIDPAHSQASFTVKHMGISNVNGRFGGISGTVTVDEKELSKSMVNAAIDTTTVDTGVAQRDTHLKSPDFFDVAKYPTITFVSKSLTVADGQKKLTGDLTLHGVTKSVTLDLEGPSKEAQMQGKTRRAFSATTTIHRPDFGLAYGGSPKSGGDAMISDDVKVELDIEAVKQ